MESKKRKGDEKDEKSTKIRKITEEESIEAEARIAELNDHLKFEIFEHCIYFLSIIEYDNCKVLLNEILKIYDENKFLTFETVIQKLLDCQLKCYYCKAELKVLYDISRQMTQWSVDRIDNDKGHNNDNFYIACLECNLKRRRRSDDKFLFTKQMKLVKVDNNDKSDNDNNNNDDSS